MTEITDEATLDDKAGNDADPNADHLSRMSRRFVWYWMVGCGMIIALSWIGVYVIAALRLRGLLPS